MRDRCVAGMIAWPDCACTAIVSAGLPASTACRQNKHPYGRGMTDSAVNAREGMPTRKLLEFLE